MRRIVSTNLGLFLVLWSITIILLSIISLRHRSPLPAYSSSAFAAVTAEAAAAASSFVPIRNNNRNAAGGRGVYHSCIPHPLGRTCSVVANLDPSTTIGGRRRTSVAPPVLWSSSSSSMKMSSSSTTTSSTTTLADFLKERKQNPTHHIAIGNEAGDADSIVSAITWSYVMNNMENDDNKGNNSSALTPVVSIPQHDLETQRPETLYLLQLAGIVADEHLLFSNEVIPQLVVIDSSSSSKQPLLNVTLVDHNRMAANLAKQLNNNFHVVEIVDHHVDEKHHLDTTTSPHRRRRMIAYDNNNGGALVASTCTLVVERLQKIRQNRQQHQSSSLFSTSSYPASLSILLLGVILLDSVNMSPAAGKGTPRDADAIQELLDHTDWKKDILDPDILDSTGRPDTAKLFEKLQNAKFEPSFWRSLSVRDALRLDYKNFAISSSGGSSSFGVSTVLMTVQDFLDREHIVAGISEYMKEKSLQFFAIMLASQRRTDDGHHEMQRELMLCGLCGTDKNMLLDLVAFLHNQGTLELVKRDIKEGEDGLTVLVFNQNNAKASRKLVAPILTAYFEQA